MPPSLTTEPERRKRWRPLLILLSRWRVDLALVLTIPMVLLARPTPRAIIVHLPLVIIGLAFRAWARGFLQRAKAVATEGPYALTRHPLYVGSFLLANGIALMANLPYLALAVSVLFLVGYIPKAIREEDYLREHFSADYARYADQVGPLWPRSIRAAGAAVFSRQGFSWQRVLGHREWKTWLGVGVIIAYLAIVAAWRAT